MLRSSDQIEGSSDLVRIRAAIEASGDILYDWNLATDKLTLLGATAPVFGQDATALPASGEDLNARINPEDMPVRMRALSEHIAGHGPFDCEYRLSAGNGEPQWIHDRGAVEVSATGAPERLIGVLRLVTQRKQHEAQLEYQANFDELTGHFNEHKKDHHSRQGLLRMVNRRRKLLDYLKGKDSDRYRKLIASLGLRR